MVNEQNRIISNPVHHTKPKLTVDEQLARLRQKGVTFKICNIDEARCFLENESYWFKIAAYRILYDKQIDGEHVGQYINLEFAYLVDLADIDKCLRQTLLPMTLDVEHYAVAQVERIVSEREDEDGYSIVVDYWNGLTAEDRMYRTNEIKRLERDYYCSELIERYRDDMPVWVFMELMTFGAFIDFYLFCANRWNDKRMRQNHYVLRTVKSVRNACAHSSSIISTFGRADGREHFNVNIKVLEALENAGISKSVRAKRMRNAAMRQIATLMYAYSHFVSSDIDRMRARKSLRRLQERMDEHAIYYIKNNMITSAFGFLKKVFQIL